jgi:hypothetical protein
VIHVLIYEKLYANSTLKIFDTFYDNACFINVNHVYQLIEEMLDQITQYRTLLTFAIFWVTTIT